MDIVKDIITSIETNGIFDGTAQIKHCDNGLCIDYNKTLYDVLFLGVYPTMQNTKVLMLGCIKVVDGVDSDIELIDWRSLYKYDEFESLNVISFLKHTDFF